MGVYVSVTTAASLAGVSRVTMLAWVRSGQIPALCTPGGQYKIARADIERGPRQQPRRASSPAPGEPTMPEEPMMRWFAYAHLPEHLQTISSPFGELAALIVEKIDRSPERTVALRKLLESKDAAVRAALPDAD